MEVHSGNSMEQIRADFQSGTSGYSLLSRGSDLRYLVYEPSGMGNGWMMCYVVSADQALEDYRFIHQYEVILTAAFLVGMAILLWYLLRSSFLERRALLRRAQSDPLTGLMNQAGTRESITDWLADGGCNGALLMLDLDHFKHVNDTWGHQVGDEVLRQAAAILQSHFRQGDIIGRMGATSLWSLCGISGTQVRWSGTWSGCGSSSTVSRSPNSPRSILPAAWELHSVPRMDRPLRCSTSAPTTPSISPSVGAGTVGASIGMSARPEDGYPCRKTGR